jgi:uncharacterized iron-regulated membrane protein
VSFVAQLLHHPRQLWIRRVNFQVHLWTGIILALYMVIIGATGAVLVFGLELSKFLDPNPWSGIVSNAPLADISQVIDILKVSYPRVHVVSLMAPAQTEPVFIATLQLNGRTTVAFHPATGQLLGEVHRRQSQLDWIYELHENLLSGRTGRVVNGVGAGALLLLALTGLVNWWAGLKKWPRAVRVDFRRAWRRLNFDLHSAIGFWSFGFLIVWATSGIYFAWPEKCFLLVNRFSPIVNAQPPAIRVDPEADITKLDFHAMLIKSQAVDPGTTWKGIIFPSSRRSPFQILRSRSPGIGRDYEDTVFFNPYNGQYISTWRYGVNKSLGDWIIWLQIPIHFGTHWGFAVKCLWAGAGLALPVLAVTGLLMYWNRVLSKRWRTLKTAGALAA